MISYIHEKSKNITRRAKFIFICLMLQKILKWQNVNFNMLQWLTIKIQVVTNLNFHNQLAWTIFCALSLFLSISTLNNQASFVTPKNVPVECKSEYRPASLSRT